MRSITTWLVLLSIIALLGLLAYLNFAPGASVDMASYNKVRTEADAFFEKGDFQAAASAYNRALQYKPGDRYAESKLEEIGEKSSNTFMRFYGGSGNEQANASIATEDGGYLIAGTVSYKNDPKRGLADMLLMKLDEFGQPEWERVYGGKGFDAAFDMIKSPKGGYWVVGTNCSQDNGSGSPSCQGWLLKVDENGRKTNEKFYLLKGSDREKFAKALNSYSDEFYVLSMSTYESGEAQSNLYFFDEKGDSLRRASFGDLLYDNEPAGMVLNENTELTVVLNGLLKKAAKSNDKFDAAKHRKYNVRVVRLTEEWNQTYNRVMVSSNNITKVSDVAESKKETNVFVGFGVNGEGLGMQSWMFSLNKKGDVLWNNYMGEAGTDALYSLTPSKKSFAASGVVNGGALWLLNFDDRGKVLWEERHGTEWGKGTVGYGLQIMNTPDGGLFTVGKQVSGNQDQFLVMRTDAKGQLKGK